MSPYFEKKKSTCSVTLLRKKLLYIYETYVYLSVYLSVCLSVCLSVYLSFYLLSIYTQHTYIHTHTHTCTYTYNTALLCHVPLHEHHTHTHASHPPKHKNYHISKAEKITNSSRPKRPHLYTTLPLHPHHTLTNKKTKNIIYHTPITPTSHTHKETNKNYYILHSH